MRLVLFFYGTLRQGCTNHHLVCRSTYLGPAVTKDPFVMVTQKSLSYPYIFKHAALHAVPVQGEMYEITDETLRRLDILEGHPDHYRRQPITVTDKRGTPHECIAYVLQDADTIADIEKEMGSQFVFVRDGDWITCKPVTSNSQI